MIRLAKKGDIQEIMAIVEVIIDEMMEVENYQWDQTYPRKEDFLRDIENETLYVYESGHIGGFICIDFSRPNEYKDLKWSSNDKAPVIHRMAVSSKFRGQGVAVDLMKHAENLCKDMGLAYIHTDTYSSNKAMNNLLIKMGYRLVGSINMMGKPLLFNCYERKVDYEKSSN
ncbi:GNAT family N-acetyltransferase [Acidaminobacter sp. JC074]|uniref:GNAT family N-acetyltransferase n=1 Tax=Acidaminobacter sp. JC074 TaxID=2530199 RepID=UPI001F0ED9DE|nr:GNAT family N-acetyltransferase [Acidaminobacter sp. JC074]MCH4891080.1 GNAT family N-acetyltransferase [Acidaminobacter sp. JC074]